MEGGGHRAKELCIKNDGMFRMLCGAGVDHNNLVRYACKYMACLSAGCEGEVTVLPRCRFTGSEVGLSSAIFCSLF